MSWLNIENLKKTSIYITPNFPSLRTKRYKVKFFDLLFILILFALSVSFITGALLIFTPAKKVLLFLENEKLAEHAVEIQNLEEKIVMLTNELSEISEINKRLKYAITLARTDSLDSTANIYDSLRLFRNTRQGFDGSIYNVIKELIEDYNQPVETNEVPTFYAPSRGIVTKGFNASEGHIGIDYGIKKGSPVYASAPGIVIFSGYTLENGYTLILKHSGSYISKYKHLGELLKDERETVTTGELIALSGNSGRNTTGPHLHFEIWKENKAINPLKILVE